MSTSVAALALLITMPIANHQGGEPARPARQEPRPAVETTNGLGLDLYRQLAAAQPGGNLFFSPWSVAIAMTMTAEGARGETAAEMQRALHVPATGERALDAVHAAFAALTEQFADAAGDAAPAVRQRIAELRGKLEAANRRCRDLEQAGDWQQANAASKQAFELAAELNRLFADVDRFDLRTANALWVAKDFALLAPYVATIDRYYQSSGVTNLDFTADVEAARRHINGWVADHTNRRITDLIPSGVLSADTRLVLTNAVYFKGEWADPFEERSTREEDFCLASGERKQVRLMHDARRGQVPYAAFAADGSFFATPDEVPVDEKQWPATYPGDAGFTMIELPYKGDSLAMLVIAPRQADGLPRVEALLSPAALAGWVQRLQPRTVDTTMLRFEQEQAVDLAATLQALGMRRAFANPLRPGGAQFGGMTAATDPAQQLYIGAVLHKAWIEVAEKGTEAAAATAVMMAVGSAMPPPPVMVPFVPVFRADRPFLYLIRDRHSGAILFVGRVLDPKA